MSRDEVQAIIDEADENGDGKLDYAEFAHMLLNTSEECVHAAKQKASQSSKATSSLHRKSSTSKKRGSVSSRKSFDRQRQREDIRMQLFSQGQTNAYLREEKSVTESPAPSTARQSVSPPPQSHLPPLATATQEPATTVAEPLPVITPVSAENNPQSTVTKPEPDETDTPQPEAPANQETAEPENKQTVNSLPDPLELTRANSLTKLPPLINAPLPPLLPPIGSTSQQDKTEKTQSDDTKPSTRESTSLEQAKEPLNCGEELVVSDSDQPPSNMADATPVTSDKDEAVTDGNNDEPVKGKTAESAQGQSATAEETEKERQTDHLQNGRGEETRRETVPSVSVVSLPPNKPKNIEVS